MKRARLWTIITLSFIALAFSARPIFHRYMWDAGRNYSTHSTEKNFNFIFNRDLPVGVKQLKIAGRSYGFKQWFWMRCKANDFALKNLLQNSNLQTTTAASASEFSSFIPSANTDFDTMDKAAVKWQDWKNIEQPEYYSWSTSDPTSWYYGYFVVDRKRHLIFAVGQME